MRLDEEGNLDYGMDQFNPQPPPVSTGGRRINPLTGLPDTASGSDSSGSDYTYPWMTDPTYKQGAGGPDASAFANDPSQQPANISSSQPGRLKPTGGSINDPAYTTALVNYYGGEAGANPSVKTDPQYWITAASRFNGDEAEFVKRMMTPEGAPEGSGATAPAGGSTLPGSYGSSDSALSSFLMNWLGSQSTAQTAGRSALMSRLMGLADQYASPVTADDPTIKASSDAYHGTTARSLQKFRTMAAERAHAEGVPTGAFDSQVGNAENTAGQSEATFTTGLMQNELQNRRTALAGVLQQAGSNLSAQDSADLQAKITAIDGLLKGQGLNLTDKGLDITKLLGEGGLANQRTAMTNQNNQFYDKEGIDSAFSSAQLDYLMRALGLK